MNCGRKLSNKFKRLKSTTRTNSQAQATKRIDWMQIDLNWKRANAGNSKINFFTQKSPNIFQTSKCGKTTNEQNTQCSSSKSTSMAINNWILFISLFSLLQNQFRKLFNRLCFFVHFLLSILCQTINLIRHFVCLCSTSVWMPLNSIFVSIENLLFDWHWLLLTSTACEMPMSLPSPSSLVDVRVLSRVCVCVCAFSIKQITFWFFAASATTKSIHFCVRLLSLSRISFFPSSSLQLFFPHCH